MQGEGQTRVAIEEVGGGRGCKGEVKYGQTSQNTRK